MEQEQPELPFDDPDFRRWEAAALAQRRRITDPLDRLHQRLAERQAAAATEEPEDQDLDEDLELVDLHGHQAQQEDEDQDEDQDLDEDGQPYPC